MQVNQLDDGSVKITSKSGKVILWLADHTDGIVVINKGDGKADAVHRRKFSSNTFLFTDARPICDWKNHELIMLPTY